MGEIIHLWTKDKIKYKKDNYIYPKCWEIPALQWLKL